MDAKLQKTSGNLRKYLADYGIVLVALTLFAVFSLLNKNFATRDNIVNIGKQITIVGTIAIGMTAVFIIGGMDLSVSAVCLLSATIIAALGNQLGVSLVLVIPLAIAAGALVGLLNGVLTVKVGISSIIVTLGTDFLIRGVSLLILNQFSQRIVVNAVPFLEDLSTATIASVPVLIVILIMLCVTTHLIFTRSEFGRQTYAVGTNPVAADLCGIKVQKLRIICYIICGIFAAIGGLILTMRAGIVSTASGSGLEFEAVAVVVLGGADLNGGRANFVMSLVAAFIIGAVANVLTLYGVNAYFQDAVKGFFLLAASIIFILRNKKN